MQSGHNLRAVANQVAVDFGKLDVAADKVDVTGRQIAIAARQFRECDFVQSLADGFAERANSGDERVKRRLRVAV